MKIIQISDFHINDKLDIEESKFKIDKLYEIVLEKIMNELVLFCICGDIFDKGNKTDITVIKEILDYIKEKFKDNNIKFEFVPGNHDLIDNNFFEYDNLISNYISNDKYSFYDKNIIVREYDECSLVLVNSVFHKEKSYGSIDIKLLEKELTNINKKVILVMHHTLMSRYNEDESPIRNSYDLFNIIEKNNIFAILHGHTHGYSEIKIGKDCNIIGIGPFLKQVPDVNNQFNFIEVENWKPLYIENYIYRQDTKEYLLSKIHKKDKLDYFIGQDLEEVYKEIVNTVNKNDHIINFKMKLTMALNEFNESVKKIFEEYIPIAEDWQKKDVPESLYYNHGMYMSKEDINGLEYVKDELQKKSTSSRAILPLVNVHNVIGSKDGFFPSLDIIQFGFESESKDELIITLYLRALEVNNFLKINISEVYLMVNKIKESITSINKINLNIFAFRAQYKEKFGCFQKAKIDRMNSIDIMMLVTDKEVEELIKLLKNKMELFETVVKDLGIINLFNSIDAYTKKHKGTIYSEEIVRSLNELVVQYKALKELREKTSIYTEISAQEIIIKESLEKLIGLFEGVDKL